MFDVGEGYRWLSDGEILLADDEFLTEENPDPPYQGREWLEVGYFEAGKHYGAGYAPVRRKMTMDINRHRLLNQCYDLCLAIESCGASTELTDAATKASELMLEINKIVLHADELPLRCDSENGMIDMGIGANVLRFAAETHQGLWDGESGPDVPVVKITDQIVFAESVAEAINREDDGGSTMLTRMLDEAIMLAVEDGCDGVDHDA